MSKVKSHMPFSEWVSRARLSWGRNMMDPFVSSIAERVRA